MDTPPARSEPFAARPQPFRRLRIRLRHSLERLGRPGTSLLDSWRRFKWIVSIVRRRLALLGRPASNRLAKLGIDVDELFWLDPSAIEFCSLCEFGLHEYKGQVVDGDWDRSRKRFDDLDVCVAIDHVCVRGGKWEDTVFYRRFLDRVSAGEPLWECRNEDDVKRRLASVNSLFHSIRQNGFRTQKDLTGPGAPWRGDDEIAICIGREGDALFSDGAHRLAAAKLLKLHQIPVKVSVRHPKWIAFRQELLMYAEELGGRLYQPALHFDLRGIPAFQNCEDRFNAIRGALPLARGVLLDIGANIGYFCHRFEEEGFTCFAAENWLRELYFLRMLKQASKRRFAIIDDSVLTSQQIRTMRFDVVLALNVFHHFLKTKGQYDLFVDLLHHLNTDLMYFEPHQPDEPQMREAFRNFSNDDFVSFVQHHTGLAHSRKIAHVFDGRSIFELRR